MSIIKVTIEKSVYGVDQPIVTNMCYNPDLLGPEVDRKQFFIDAVVRLKEVNDQEAEEQKGIARAANINKKKFKLE